MKMLLLAAACLFLPAMAACQDEHVSHTTTEQKGLFGTTVKDTTVKQRSDGSASVDQTTTKVPNP